MTDNKILNSQPADSTSKLIFDDPILCSQFLRDYIDLPWLKAVQPEEPLPIYLYLFVSLH